MSPNVFTVILVSFLQDFTKSQNLNLTKVLPSNITTAQYSVTPTGKDTTDCLQQNNGGGNCRTVTFIIRNECQPDKHLHIKLIGNNTYREPCWESPPTEINGKTYPCFMTLFGDESGNRPILTCENGWSTDKSIGTNIISHILEYSPSTLQGCNVHSDTPKCSHSKLYLLNVRIKKYDITHIGNHRITATNTYFENVSILADPKTDNQCYFSCHLCQFYGYYTSPNYVINFNNCTSVGITVTDTIICSGILQVLFLNEIRFEMINVTLTGEFHRGSQIILQQISKKYWPRNSKQIVMFQNLTVMDNDVGSDAILSIDIISPRLFTQSEVTLVSCSCVRSSSFLHYVATDDNVNKNTPISSNHSLMFNNLILKDNFGIESLITIKQLHGSSVEVVDSRFENNSITSDVLTKGSNFSTFSIFSIHVSELEGMIKFTRSTFQRNMVGKVIYVETLSHNPSLLGVYDNATISYGEPTIDLVEAIFVPSIDLIIQDCAFNSNYANYSNGAVHIQTSKRIKALENELLMVNDLQLQTNISQSYGLAINARWFKNLDFSIQFHKKLWRSIILCGECVHYF